MSTSTSTYHGYSESDLVSNRASLLVHGGSANDRRAWAEEAQRCFEAEGPLVTITAGAQLAAALGLARGVVFVPDVSVLSNEEQGRIVRCLQEREERPKFILGVGEAPEAAMNAGKLRGDLWYRLAQAQLDLSSGELKDAIRARRQLAEAAAAKAAAKAEKARPAAARGAKTAPKKAAARSVKAVAKPKQKIAARTPRPKSAVKAKARPAKKR